jgi:hypothetical protein
MQSPERIASKEAGNQRDPGHQPRYIHIAKGWMVAHSHQIQLVTEVAVVVSNHDVCQERGAGDNQYGRRDADATKKISDAYAR